MTRTSEPLVAFSSVIVLPEKFATHKRESLATSVVGVLSPSDIALITRTSEPLVAFSSVTVLFAPFAIHTSESLIASASGVAKSSDFALITRTSEPSVAFSSVTQLPWSFVTHRLPLPIAIAYGPLNFVVLAETPTPTNSERTETTVIAITRRRTTFESWNANFTPHTSSAQEPNHHFRASPFEP